jgi:glycerol-3-phosphate acyltransferase PlsX
MRADMDFDAIGGVPLLGVNGVVVVAHGGSSQRALVSAIDHAARAAASDLPRRLREALPLTESENTTARDFATAS